MRSKSTSNTITFLFSEQSFEKNISDSLFNSRIIRVVPTGKAYKLFLSCEGETTENLIDIWSNTREQFVLETSFKLLQSSCLQILKTKTFRGGLTGIVPYNIMQKGFPGAYGDMYRILSHKFGFSLVLNLERGFGSFDEANQKWDNGLHGKVISITPFCCIHKRTVVSTNELDPNNLLAL